MPLSNQRRASYYLHIVFPDGTDSVCRVVGEKGKETAADFERLARKVAPTCSRTEHISSLVAYNILRKHRQAAKMMQLG